MELQSLHLPGGTAENQENFSPDSRYQSRDSNPIRDTFEKKREA